MTTTASPTKSHPLFPANYTPIGDDVRSNADPPPRPPVEVRQLSRRGVFGTWAAAALPMGALSWIVAPFIAHHLHGDQRLLRALLLCLTAGLVWQSVLVFTLVGIEQRSLRWSVLREALWLRRPQSPKTGKRGGRLWWLVVPLLVAVAAEQLIPSVGIPASRDFAKILDSPAGKAFFHGNWTYFAVMVVLGIFNTVLGEELLFRGYLLPRMDTAFGRKDWLVNGLLFTMYHVHVPWVMPATLCDTFILAGPSRRYRSAWYGIIVHSAQTVVITAAVLALVLK